MIYPFNAFKEFIHLTRRKDRKKNETHFFFQDER